MCRSFFSVNMITLTYFVFFLSLIKKSNTVQYYIFVVCLWGTKASCNSFPGITMKGSWRTVLWLAILPPHSSPSKLIPMSLSPQGDKNSWIEKLSDILSNDLSRSSKIGLTRFPMGKKTKEHLQFKELAKPWNILKFHAKFKKEMNSF